MTVQRLYFGRRSPSPLRRKSVRVINIVLIIYLFPVALPFAVHGIFPGARSLVFWVDLFPEWLWLLVLGGTLPACIASIVLIFYFDSMLCRKARLLQYRMCIYCGYDLSRCSDDRCPECGEPFTQEMLEAHWTKRGWKV